jgi:hypothetical protein
MTEKIAENDKMSNLKTTLMEIEKGHIDSNGVELTETRNRLPAALQAYTQNRFDLGEILFKYRELLKPTKRWGPTARAIAAAINRDERTVYRIVKGYELAIQLSPEVLAVLAERNVDPAEPKNSRAVRKLLEMPKPVSPQDADAAVKYAFDKVSKTGARKTAQTKSDSVEDFTARVVNLFAEWYQGAMPQQRDNDVRHALEMVIDDLVKLGADRGRLQPRKSGIQLGRKPVRPAAMECEFPFFSELHAGAS